MQENASEIPRDYYLDKRDIANIKEKLDQLTWKLDVRQEVSLRLWVQSHADNVLLYKEFKHGAASDFEVFRVGLTRPELLQAMVKHGHDSAFLIDSTFGTNSAKVILCLSCALCVLNF